MLQVWKNKICLRYPSCTKVFMCWGKVDSLYTSTNKVFTGECLLYWQIHLGRVLYLALTSSYLDHREHATRQWPRGAAPNASTSHDGRWIESAEYMQCMNLCSFETSRTNCSLWTVQTITQELPATVSFQFPFVVKPPWPAKVLHSKFTWH